MEETTIKKGREMKNLVINYENGDRETIEEGIILVLNEERSTRVMISQIASLDVLLAAVNLLDVSVKNGVISEKVTDAFAMALAQEMQDKITEVIEDMEKTDNKENDNTEASMEDNNDGE